jgi:4-hydroxy-3-polyprenylbenzoate decarboxylase
MKYHDLRDFMGQLERQGDLRRVSVEVSPRLEMTEICDRTLRAAGPAVLFQKPTGHSMPVLGNLFGTPQRVAWGMGADSVSALREVGELLASLREPEAPKGLRDALGKVAMLKSALWDMAPREVRGASAQEVAWEGDDVDLARLPVQTCWPGDAGPLITWGWSSPAARTRSGRTSGSIGSR